MNKRKARQSSSHVIRRDDAFDEWMFNVEYETPGARRMTFFDWHGAYKAGLTPTQAGLKAEAELAELRATPNTERTWTDEHGDEWNYDDDAPVGLRDVVIVQNHPIEQRDLEHFSFTARVINHPLVASVRGTGADDGTSMFLDMHDGTEVWTESDDIDEELDTFVEYVEDFMWAAYNKQIRP